MYQHVPAGPSASIEEKAMAKNERTSKRAGSAAARVMRDKRTGKASKTAAASALTQRPDKKTRGK